MTMPHIGRKAFTLIELLVVVAIIGLLSSVAVVSMNSSRSKAKLAAGQSFDASLMRSAGSEIIGEWLLDEGSGAVAADTSGNGHNGTVTAASWVAGLSGNALSFPGGINANVSLGSDAAFAPAAFTITAWIKPGDFSGSYNYIFSNARDCCGTYNGIEFRVSANKLLGTVWNAGVAKMQYSNSAVSNDPVWTFAAFSYDGAKTALYLNGRLDASSGSSVGVGSPASFGSFIGRMAACSTCTMNGTIDQVRFYGTAVVASEIEKIYLAERGKYLARK